MTRIDVAAIPVVVAALYLLGLAVLAVAAPKVAARFLASHASTAVAHVVELALRLTVGGALLVYAPRMLFSEGFTIVAWVLITSSLVLLLLPWQWHQRFARSSVPQAVQHLPLLALGAVGAGIALLLAVFRGP